MKITVGKKLAIGFAAILLLVVIVGGISLSSMSSINSKVEEINTSWMPGVESINNLNYLTEHVVTVTLRHVMRIGNQSDNEKQRNDAINAITKTFDDYQKTIFLPEDRKNFNELKSKWQTYLDTNNKLIELSKANDTQGVTASLSAGKQSFDAMQSNLDALVKLNHTGAQQAAATSSSIFNSSIWVISFLIIIALLIGIAATVFFIRIITKPLVMVTNTIGKVAKGDLTVEPLRVKSKDEIAILAHSCNEMVTNLRELISGTLNTAQSVAAASQQISASTEEIASGSTSQANAAQMMSELFNELSTAINSVALSAEQASELSNKTMDIAKDGGKVVSTSIDGMNQINEQMSRLKEDSNKIGEIIEVIDDIAEQTNLLALNAAIEAARAGEQGRGFAVVADEVRKLAERSSGATKQITVIIKGIQENTQQSVKAVGEGVALSQKSGEAFDNIITMVNESAQRVTEIAAASEEQAAQSSEVLISIESISASTEESAASSEETASTAQSLAQLAEELNSAVAIFKIN
ncbi:methyl-accepting chemotaxis protein [Paenibacillus frigoriresistens]|uniref:methyl-accepting chemotaxis protein n=1 Tax=Paenibacillus alginolyticus TaxID=59839 RepID=UPI001564A147|nr:methyl-accepting chemotaxis protein [Paenibacillus frigoriresistens]NRF96069.1 methyl-accepting chemotaxis protein [Paenibacillus frigoriresistens]